MPQVYRFLLDARDELNAGLPLVLAPAGAAGQFTIPAYRGVGYSLQRAASPTSAWNSLTNWSRGTEPWSNRNIQLPADTSGYYRVRGE